MRGGKEAETDLVQTYIIKGNNKTLCSTISSYHKLVVEVSDCAALKLSEKYCRRKQSKRKKIKAAAVYEAELCA